MPAWLLLILLAGMQTGCSPSTSANGRRELLHVSYDVTRELWQEINPLFLAEANAPGAPTLTIRQSHGGSGSQARAVIDGLEADVVSLAMWSDLDALRKAGLIAEDWQQAFPHNASPFHSTVVFVVRKGNPKTIRDWPDLIAPSVEIITPNPKTSGNGKLSFLAAWGSVTARGGTPDAARAYVQELYRHAPILETGGRGATTAFVQKKIGDVQLAWENEAWLAVRESGGNVEIVYPPVSLRAEPHIALVTKNSSRHGTEEIARQYLDSFFTPESQAIYAKHHLRPNDRAVMARFADQFPAVELFGVEAVSTDWDAAQKTFFADGGVFDSLYQK